MTDDSVEVRADVQGKEALERVKEKLSAGEAPLKGLNDSRRAMEIVDRRFENCGYFIPDLIYSAGILKEIT